MFYRALTSFAYSMTNMFPVFHNYFHDEYASCFNAQVSKVVGTNALVIFAKGTEAYRTQWELKSLMLLLIGNLIIVITI